MPNRLPASIGLAAMALALLAASPALSKTYEGRECRQDYKRLCPQTPIGKCDLQSMMEKLSPKCKAFIQKSG